MPNKSGNLRHQLFDTGILLYFSDTVLNIPDTVEWNGWLQTSPMHILIYILFPPNPLKSISAKCVLSERLTYIPF